MLYIAGNCFKSAIKVSHKEMSKNKIPIINYVKEFTCNENETYNEYNRLLNFIDSRTMIALKLSSLNFNENLINKLIESYKKKNINILIDAENSKDNNLYNQIVNRLILRHNDEDYRILKTYQMYRLDSFQQLNNDINLFSKYNKNIGVKLVRGAYWNSEKNNGQLFTSKYDTNLNYNNAIKFLDGIDSYNILATHNKDSIELGLKMKSKFKYAHLLDMNTKIYDKLAKTENVHVYIPYGPFYDMVPYLLRRLYENMDMVKYMIK